MNRAAAFTLMELAVAIAMAGVVVGVGTMAGMHINGTLIQSRRELGLADQAKRLEEAILGLVQEAGGDPLTPAMAIRLEQGRCGAQGGTACAHDRITIVRTDSGDGAAEKPLPVCRVTSSGTMDFQVVTVAGVCCLFPDYELGVDPLPVPGGVNNEATRYSKRNAIFITDLGVAHDVRLGQTKAGCQIAAASSSPAAAFTTGILVPVNRQVIFARADPSIPSAVQLVRWRDVGDATNGPDGVANVSEFDLLADRVFSFQMALGYDGPPLDGNVEDSNSASDDWVGTISADARPAALTDDQLRMVGVGLIVGVPRRGHTGSARVYDSGSVTVANTFLKVVQSKVGIRNLDISLP
jgi:hypothetical protein